MGSESGLFGLLYGETMRPIVQGKVIFIVVAPSFLALWLVAFDVVGHGMRGKGERNKSGMKMTARAMKGRMKPIQEREKRVIL